MSAGYIYVLVNSSMPGLVKVGKTTRDPTARVSELSGATGVATPFVLAFKQFFDDCDTAEFQVHYALEARGHRVSTGREFFRADSDEIIHLVIDTAKSSVTSAGGNIRIDDADILLGATDDEFALPELPSAPPWEAVLREADDLHYGTEDEIEDPVRALSLYKDSIRLGGLIGYERVGQMHQFGDAVPQSDAKALDYFRTGAEKGNYYCWAQMASLFHRIGSDENATKCWKRFFDTRSARPDALIEEYPEKFLGEVCDCCVYCMLDNEHTVLLDYLRGLSSEIRTHCDARIAICAKQGETTDWYFGVKRWISRL
jgi:hypothetical protein